MPLRALPLSCLLIALAACAGDGPSHEDDVPVTVGMVALDESNVPVVVLEEQGGDRWLPIWIGSFEARSIAAQMKAQTPLRPNTHDLAKSLIANLEGQVVRVVVTELRGGTYYALLSVRANGTVMQVDSRPSDAIAIALRTDAPIFVRAPVFEAAGEAGPKTGTGERRIRWRAPADAQPGGAREATPHLGL